ncbi:MAG: hypothetical protein LBS81_03790 [Endomicrobium sp.]|jgi:hypothetical protein|nr:hypothetical protein [Endomicrobium sp.]
MRDYYRIPVNVSFTIDNNDFVYEAYVRQIDGIHVIGLKLKGSYAGTDLDAEKNSTAASLAFVKDINTSSLRNNLNTLKENGALATNAITSSLEINQNGAAMVNFVGF